MELDLRAYGQRLHVRHQNMGAAMENTVCCNPGRGKPPGRKAMGRGLSQSWRCHTMILLLGESRLNTAFCALDAQFCATNCARRAL